MHAWPAPAARTLTRNGDDAATQPAMKVAKKVEKSTLAQAIRVSGPAGFSR